MEPQPVETPPKRTALTRIILLALLGAAAVALMFDWRARTEAADAFERIEAAQNANPTENPKVPADVQKLAGRPPTDDGDNIPLTETYSWGGALRNHNVYVIYNKEEDPATKKVTVTLKKVSRTPPH